MVYGTGLLEEDGRISSQVYSVLGILEGYKPLDEWLLS
jgi:hypothetical protein